MAEQSPHASQSAVVLDIGDTIGALLLYTSSADNEAEIDISPGDDSAAQRTHNQVHPRKTPNGTVYCAVYPALPAGNYTIWRDHETAEATVIIRGGCTTEHHLSAPLPAHHRHAHTHH